MVAQNRFSEIRHRLVAVIAGAVGALLTATVTAQPPDDQYRDLVRVRLEQEADPLLRLNTGGHTAVVRGLAFLPDSQRLCSAGLDKDVQVWNVSTVFRDLRRVYLRERTLRWQVARGLRGGIYAMDAAPSDGLLAIGGYGAMGTTGEILLLDPLEGSLVGVLDRHRQTVSSLAFSSDGNWLASIDLDGRATLWKRQGWQPVGLDEPDPETYGAATAERIAASTDIRPIVIAGSTRAILPRFSGSSGDGRLRWQLRVIDLAFPAQSRLLDAVHFGMVTALAASADGQLLASADLAGNLSLWELETGRLVQRLAPGGIPVSLCFSPDKKTLAVGTAVEPGGKESQVQVWSLDPPLLKARFRLTDHVWACRISPDGTRLAHSGGNNHEVFVRRIDQLESPVALQGKGRRILKAAFDRGNLSYRFALGWDYRDRGFNDYADLQAGFDPQRLQLDPLVKGEGERWLSPESFRGNWTLRRQETGGLQLYRSGSSAGTIALDPLLEGNVRSYCWIPNAAGTPVALAVGTDKQNTIHVFQLVSSGSCPLLRQFRGHSDYVTSVGVSADGRYLVSASADGTVCLWSLELFEQGVASLSRWGAEFSVEGDRLVASRVLPAGPLFAKGLREGDTLQEIRWPAPAAGGKESAEEQPEAIRSRLEALPWMTQVRFTATSPDGSRKVFQRVPAWQPLATLFVSTDGEWAFWTPEGYYDASINGHTLFGWQVNRGIHALPDFYRADQYQQTLERPAVMERLLDAGSLQSALEAADAQPAIRIDEVLPARIAATPQVRILSPRPGTVIEGGFTLVEAQIRTPKTSKLVSARVFANGVVATQQEILQERDLPDSTEITTRWRVPLPADERALIQLVVTTDTPVGAFSNVVVDRHSDRPEPERLPNLHLMAVGINQYADRQVPPLAFSVADATAVAERMETVSKKLYNWQERAFLSDEEVAPERWRESLQRIADQLKSSAQPDDLLVVFMAGHGVVDPANETYYFLGHGTRFDDVDAGTYEGSIGWDDFRVLADVPCRKLVLLDTCHSGAIQPLRSSGLKAAIRALQADVVLAVTASAGHEKAAENPSWGHGIFTKSLLDGLAGKADTSGDGMVTLDEMISYVTQAVSEATGGRQNPTAGPKEILPFVTLPLARVDGAAILQAPSGTKPLLAEYPLSRQGGD